MAAKSPAQISVEDFAACVDKTFEVATEEYESEVLKLTLVSAVELGKPIAPGGRVPFSLTFDGPAETPLEQGTYRFSHSDFEVLEIFIVPVGENGNTRTYEAIFS